LIADAMQQAGEGLLRAKFEALKIGLDAEGLFNPELKKSLPRFPLRIAVITSPSGAALRDILQILRRRWPLAQARVYGVPVQGDEAAPAIVRALQAANQHAWAQLLVLSRGGGSLEDLWAFNEEIVARAIFASELPVVSAIGHEIDYSISDFVADLRAPTPSAAAELISPDQKVIKNGLATDERRLQQLITTLLQGISQKLDHLAHRLAQQHPGQRLVQHSKMLQLASHRLKMAAQQIVPNRLRKLQLLARTLNAVSPLPTLARGYAIVSDAASGTTISSVKNVKTGQLLLTQLADGRLRSVVEDVDDVQIDGPRMD